MTMFWQECLAPLWRGILNTDCAYVMKSAERYFRYIEVKLTTYPEAKQQKRVTKWQRWLIRPSIYKDLWHNHHHKQWITYITRRHEESVYYYWVFFSDLHASSCVVSCLASRQRTEVEPVESSHRYRTSSAVVGIDQLKSHQCCSSDHRSRRSSWTWRHHRHLYQKE